MITEKDAEIRILRRERDESLNTKMEIMLENRSLKVYYNHLLIRLTIVWELEDDT